MQQVTFQAMGCQIVAIVDDDAPETIETLAEVPLWFEQWEQSFSRFRADSELSHINQRSGLLTLTSSAMAQVIQLALDVAQQTGSLVVPHMLNALELAGYDRSFELLASRDPACISPLPPATPDDWQYIVLGSRPRTILMPAGMRLDLGGVAKGWVAQQAARRLGMYGPALVSAGGDIAISEPLLNDQPWPVSIDDPFAPENSLGTVMLSTGGIATSGQDHRCWQQHGKRQHHIIDPRTLRPAETDVISVTVIAPSTAQAESAAKVVLILGSDTGLDWLDARPELAAMLVLDNQDILYTNQFEDYLHPTIH